MGGVHVVQLAAVLAAVSFVVVGSSAIDVAGVRTKRRTYGAADDDLADDGGITSSQELRRSRPMTDFGHPPKYTGTIRKPLENKEYLNPPINVFMPTSTAQQVLVRQALLKGQSLGRIPDFGTNAKQFLAMGETANKAIDALKKLPHCVVGNCGGNQVMTFGGSHPEKEKELDFAEQAQDEAGGFEEDRMENDQLTVDLIKSIDLQFNEPAFEKNILEDPVLDSPAIEPEASFFWKSPPPGLEVYPVMPPDPPPGPYSDKQDVRPVGQEGEQKSDAAQFHEMMRQAGTELKGCIDSLDWDAIMGWVFCIMGCIITAYMLYQFFLVLCQVANFDWTQIFGGCNLVGQLSEEVKGCAQPFSVCDFWSCTDGSQPEATEGQKENKKACDAKCGGLGFLDINICDMLGSSCGKNGASGGGAGGGGGGGGGGGRSSQQGYVYSGMGIGGSSHGLSDEALQEYIRARYGTPAALAAPPVYNYAPSWHVGDIQESMRGHQQPQRPGFAANQQQAWNVPAQQSSANIIHYTGSTESAPQLTQPPQYMQGMQRTVSFQQPAPQQQQQFNQHQQTNFISAAGGQQQSMSQAQAQFMQPNHPRNDSYPQPPPQGFYSSQHPPRF